MRTLVLSPFNAAPVLWGGRGLKLFHGASNARRRLQRPSSGAGDDCNLPGQAAPSGPDCSARPLGRARIETLPSGPLLLEKIIDSHAPSRHGWLSIHDVPTSE